MSKQTQKVERELTMSRAMVEAIAAEMREDEAVFYMGEDVAVVTLGLHVHRALDAAERLAANGIDAEVVDLRSLVPLDTIVRSIEKTGNLVVVVDEDYRSYGVTSEIVASVADEALGALDAVERLALPDVPIPYSRPMEQAVVPDADDIVAAVERTQ